MRAVHHRSRGFTLVELLISSTIFMIAVATGASVLIAQYRTSANIERTRQANGSSRDAALEMEQSLRRLGWGIDPRFAFDFFLDCVGPTPGCRDSTAGSDQLAFVARNPLYRWDGAAFSGNAWRINSVTAGAPPRIKVTLPDGVRLEKGRIILATCALGTDATMIRLEDEVVGAGVEEDLVPQPALLAPYNSYDGLKACHSLAGGAVFLVDRYRYFIRSYDGRPWLMLDTGLDADGDGTLPPADTDDLIPIAPDVEDMQVAYSLNSTTLFPAPDSGVPGDWIIGNRNGVQEEPNPAADAPTYTTGANEDERFSLHPANIRGVRLSLSLRASSVSPDGTDESLVANENRVLPVSGGGYRRFISKSSVTIRNLDTSNPFIF